MTSNKKAMEMSMNTIIIAVIALLILGIMIFLLARNSNGFSKGITCPSYGGKCQTSSCDSNRDLIYHWEKGSLCEGNEICCSIVPNKGKDIIEGPKGKDIVMAR